MNLIPAGKSLKEGKVFAQKLSTDNPGKYITLCACFRLFAQIDKRLHIHAPSNSGNPFIDTGYWLNGKHHPFTEKQCIADQNATPARC